MAATVASTTRADCFPATSMDFGDFRLGGVVGEFCVVVVVVAGE